MEQNYETVMEPGLQNWPVTLRDQDGFDPVTQFGWFNF